MAGRRFASSFTSRSPLQRKTIGALRDPEQHLLFGTAYERKSQLDPTTPPPPEAGAPNTTALPETTHNPHADLQAAIHGLGNLPSTPATSASSTPFIAALLRRTAAAKSPDLTSALHTHLHRLRLASNPFLANLLMHAYAQSGHLREAREIFESLEGRNKFSYTIMLSAYAKARESAPAIELYESMVAAGEEIDDVLLTTVIGVCAASGDLQSGMRIHRRLALPSKIVSTALLNMYGKCGRAELARRVFDQMPERDQIAWNAMLAAYAQNWQCAPEAIALYNRMIGEARIIPDEFTYSTVLLACAAAGRIGEGREIHLEILKRGMKPDLTLQNTILNMYAKCGRLDEARRMFDGMWRKSVISWSTIISACTQSGDHHQALELYSAMEKTSPSKPNCITYSSALSACAGLSDLARGREIHRRVIEEKWDGAAVIASALIHMYSKCSCLDEARAVFEETGCKDLVCGNTMIGAYVQFAELESAVEVYRKMVASGTNPSGITLIGLIIGASQAGRVEQGREYFVEMVEGFGSGMVLWEHYMCLVDLLGRSGWLADAEELVETMPFEPCVTGWVTLLSGCRMHGDVERAERASGKIWEMEPDEGSYQKLMLGTLQHQESNGKWDVVGLLRRKMLGDRFVSA